MVNDIEIPIRVASDIAKEFGLSQVVIWCVEPDGRQHVVTYGDTLENKARAADAGNRVKHAAGWPEELQHAVPGPVEKVLASQRAAIVALRRYLEAHGEHSASCDAHGPERGCTCELGEVLRANT